MLGNRHSRRARPLLSTCSGVWFEERQIRATAVAGCAEWQPLQAQGPDALLCTHPLGSAGLAIRDAYFKIYPWSLQLCLFQNEGPSAEVIPGATQFGFACASKSCKPDIVPGEELLEKRFLWGLSSPGLCFINRDTEANQSQLLLVKSNVNTQRMGTAGKWWNPYLDIESVFLASFVFQCWNAQMIYEIV